MHSNLHVVHTRSKQALTPGRNLDQTSTYPTELPYLILLPIRLLLTRPYTVLPGQITLPNQTSANPIVTGHLT
jgi:hypothetical protein